MAALVFIVSAFIVLVGAMGVVLSRNPVHAALFLIQALFGVAVLFLVVDAHFLAAIQVIVYAGAIVVLFLFVIMLLGVDQAEDLRVEPIVGQRPLAVLSGAAIFGLLLAIINSADGLAGVAERSGALDRIGPDGAVVPDVEQLAEEIFTRHVFAFEATGLLLTVAVVGAVMMARKISGPLQPLPDIPGASVETAPAPDEQSEADIGTQDLSGERSTTLSTDSDTDSEGGD